MGTRFLASTEMAVRREWKEMIMRAESREARHSAVTDLILPPYNRPHDPASARVLPTAFAEELARRPNELIERAVTLGPRSSPRSWLAVERSTCPSPDKVSD